MNMSPNPAKPGSSFNNKLDDGRRTHLERTGRPSRLIQSAALQARSGSILRQTFRFLLIAALLFVTAHRLPAPISEIPESPTPAPEQSAKPKPKRTIKPKASESSESSTKAKTSSPPQSKATPQHNLFDGTWIGKTCVGFDGSHETMDVTIFISAGGTRVDVKMVGAGFASQEGGVGEKVYTSKKPTCDGRTVKWNDGWGNWVLTPNSDRKTAHFTCDWSPGLLLLPACHSSETFQKVLP